MSQPYLHDLVTCVAAPTAVLSGTDGQLRTLGAQGVLRADRRLLSRFTVELDAVEPEPVGHALEGASTCRFVAIARGLGDPGPDPTVRLVRERTASGAGLVERLVLSNDSHVTVRTVVSIRLASDLASIADVKSGRSCPPLPPNVAAGRVRWKLGAAAVTVACEPAPVRTGASAGEATLDWDVELSPRGRWTAMVRLSATEDLGRFRPGAGRPWSVARVRAADRDLARLVDRSLADLAGLTLIDAQPGTDVRDGGPEVFLGAGSPWYLTLFGRDSLWAARLLLPLGTTLAHGTLRTLARYQGSRFDERTGEAPGKIIHELREEHAGIGLPARYYGTIDATALWVCTLHDAWRWGLEEGLVRELLDPLRAALDWLTGPADTDADGFLEYVDTGGTGLANQGWKDSGDGVQWPDGRIADPPIALCEAQAYAHGAAVAGAKLLAAHGVGAADARRAAELLAWAAALRGRFRSTFWVRDRVGPFPALALDAAKRPVDSVTSNLGHLLGTGLLEPAEAALVADRLAGPDLDCGYGLRTLSRAAAGANPLGYHTGSVWPHDTAIAVLGLAREGHGEVAAQLAHGLLAAAPSFGYRMPELFGGTDARQGEPVLAYPAACRPQAWAAAASIALVQAALGLTADVPAGELRVQPHAAFADWFPMRATGLRVAGHDLAITVEADGTPHVATDAPLRVGIGNVADGPGTQPP
jgi:glycogen debranching enzyme